MDSDSKDLVDDEAERSAATAPRNKTVSSALRKHQRWESHRQEIYQLYMVENNTLKRTMEILKDKYGFRPSERKYKEKLKTWKFDKYVSGEEMKFIVAKDERRENEGKATAFYSCGIEISSRRIQAFKKRAKQQTDGMDAPQSPPAATPQGITYNTPLSESSLQPQPAKQMDDGASPPSDLIFHTESGVNDHPSVKQALEEEIAAQSLSLELTPLPIFFEDPTTNSVPQSMKDAGLRDLYQILHPRIEYEENGSVRDISIEETRRLAEGHKTSGNLSEAASEYLRLARMLGRERGLDSKEVFEALSHLADVERAQNKLEDSIETYRTVLAGHNYIFRPFALETAKISHKLGKVLEENDELVEAEYRYRTAITAFKVLGDSGLRDCLDCQSSLGNLLSDEERYEEALELFLPVVIGYKELGLSHRTISVLGSILEVYINLQDWRKRNETIQEMRLLLETRINDVDFDHSKFLEFLLEGIHLGSINCQMMEYKLARELLSRVIPKLELLDDATYDVEKIYGYMEYGNCHMRLGDIEQARFYLSLAKTGLNRLNRLSRHDDPVVAFVDGCLREILLRSRLKPLSNPSELRKESFMNILGVHAVPHTDDEIICEGSRKNGEDTTDAGTSSCKYGVTFSMTDITGISISGYLPT